MACLLGGARFTHRADVAAKNQAKKSNVPTPGNLAHPQVERQAFQVSLIGQMHVAGPSDFIRSLRVG
jgi:hypothetical protein